MLPDIVLQMTNSREKYTWKPYFFHLGYLNQMPNPSCPLCKMRYRGLHMYWHVYKDRVTFHLRVNLRVLSTESSVMKKFNKYFLWFILLLVMIMTTSEADTI